MSKRAGQRGCAPPATLADPRLRRSASTCSASSTHGSGACRTSLVVVAFACPRARWSRLHSGTPAPSGCCRSTSGCVQVEVVDAGAGALVVVGPFARLTICTSRVLAGALALLPLSSGVWVAGNATDGVGTSKLDPSPSLVTEAGGVRPGRALDAGCGVDADGATIGADSPFIERRRSPLGRSRKSSCSASTQNENEGQTSSHAKAILRRDAAPCSPDGLRRRLPFRSRPTGLDIKSD